MGIFWIQGLGGGIDNLYDTICMVSDVPPISLLMSGKFALFSVLSARADLELSLRGFEVDISELGIKDVTLIDNLGLEVRWYPALFMRGDIAINILGIIDGGGYIVLEESLEDGSIFWEAFATAGLMIPDYVPLIGGYEVGRASLGINCNKIWGAMAVIGIDFGVTYYWGGDVDFGLGKYDAPEPTYPLRRSVPVAYNAQTGRTLYMSMGTNATLRAQTSGTTASGEYSVNSSTDRMTHTVSLGGYLSTRDMMLTMTYQAATRAEAEEIAKQTVKIVATDDKSVAYELKWLDSDKYADEQNDANAIFSYDESSGEAMVTVSFTDGAVYAHDWKITTGASSELALYEMDRMASVDSASYAYDQATGSMSVHWDGYALSDIDELTVYAVAEDGTGHRLHQTANVEAGTVTFDLPATLPSGTYMVQVVASSEENNISCAVSADQSFDYVNPAQPTAPTVDRVALGGDYSIDVDLTAGQNTDGYVITVEEKITEAGETRWESTSLGSQQIETADGSTITVGGQYETTVYVDSEGNTLSYADAQGRDDVTATAQIKGLEAGKTYRLKIVAYHEDGGELLSEAAYSEEITMVAPAKPSVSVSATGATVLDGVSYIHVTEAIFNISSDMAISGTWSLDDGAQEGTFEADTRTSLTIGGRPETDDLPAEDGLSEGQHTLTLTGTNASGDAFSVDYVFCVKATAPRLQIATPNAGSFFGETVSVTGLSEPGAKLYVLLDGKEVSSLQVDATGEFSVSVPMDTNMFEQTVSVYAEDAIGNVSRQYDFKLTNAIVTAPDNEISIFLNGIDYTNSVIPAGASGTLELKMVSGEKSITVPASSILGSQAEWSVEVVDGSAELSGTQLTTDSDVNGMLKVSFEGHDVAAVLGGNNLDDVTAPEIEISVGGSSWNTFVSLPGFATYFNEKQSVTVSASNGEIGIREVYYLVSPTPLTLEQISALAPEDWTAYTEAFEIAPTMECVIYVMATDNNGNVAYGSSDGIVLKDRISVSGIEDGKTYEGDLTVTVDDPHLDYVKVDGALVELTDGQFTVKADGKSHTIEIADKAGNTAVYTVTVVTPEEDETTSVPTDSEDTTQAVDEGGLPVGAVAGIVIGAVLITACGGFAIFWFVIKKRKWSDLFHR